MANDPERWRPVEGWPGYFVSDYGRVVGPKGRTLKPGLSTTKAHGRWQVTLHRTDGRQASKKVHKLVIEAFIGPRPPGMHACHNDGNRDNNRLDNLRYDTPAGNNRDKIAHGTSQSGERNGSAKLTFAQVEAIRRQYQAGTTQVALAEDYGVTQANISMIVLGRTWKGAQP